MVKEILIPKLKNPVFIIAWPGMGEVAYKSALFLKEALQFKMFAKLEAHEFFKPAAVVVDKGIIDLPTMPAGFFYYYKSPSKSRDILLFLGDAQPPLDKGEQLARSIIAYVKKYKVKLMLSFAAKPEPTDHKSPSHVWVTSTHKDMLEQFKKFPTKVLSEGQISGLNGIILGVAKQNKIKGVCLLGEIPFYTVQIENPKANIKILSVVDKFLNLKLDLAPLEERAKFIEEEIDKLIAYIKGDAPQGPLPLNEEDIDKIKKDLTAFTKLPQSGREKIEQLFNEASKDLSRASELKEELDRWSVYKEYEDRFLDLFKKQNKDKGN
ncbi:MAG: proteasome assembly chaperone family protein [Candidatus Omnitrophica bacterium]|nr:proteasome assembly chaperone family protein [Candidatus Omnitrophota bacterium]